MHIERTSDNYILLQILALFYAEHLVPRLHNLARVAMGTCASHTCADTDIELYNLNLIFNIFLRIKITSNSTTINTSTGINNAITEKPIEAPFSAVVTIKFFPARCLPRLCVLGSGTRRYAVNLDFPYIKNGAVNEY